MIKGKAIAKFGKGDVSITPVLHTFGNGDRYIALVLQNKGTHKVGEHISAELFEREDSDTVLFFSNTESIDVMIERLELSKEIFNGNLGGCIDSKISYYDLIEESE